MGSTFSGSNTYGTTLAKIISKNNIDTYSSAASISSGSLYPTYKLTGAASVSISGIKISLNTTNNTYTMSK